MSNDSGFIEPPPWVAPAESPEHITDDAPQPDAITLPPGIADSATHRLSQERSRTTSPKPEIVFFPGVPGTGRPAPEETISELEHPDAPISDETVLVARPARSWRLVVPGSPPILVSTKLFLGRNPAPTPGHERSPVFAIDDTTKTISKTHAMLDVVGGELRVHDLHSTNGVWVVPADGEAIEVEPGEPVVIPAGAELELGDVVIQVELA